MGSSPASAPYAYTTPPAVATVPGAPKVTAAAQDPASYELAVTIQAPASDGGSGGVWADERRAAVHVRAPASRG